MKVRMKDIAELANVSETTVSLVLNDRPSRISQEKRAEILRIAKELNYLPNMMARGLASRKTNIIGLILPDVENPFFATLAKEIQQQLYQDNFFTIFVNSNDMQDIEFKLIDELINLGVEGLLIALSNESYLNRSEMINKLSQLSVPYVLLDRNYDDLDAYQVFFDNELGGYLATKHLIDLGHKQIGFINGPSYIESINQRFLGYQRALSEANIPYNEDYTVTGDLKFLSGYTIAPHLLAHKELTGVVSANDLMLFGFMKKAAETGIRIPEQLSVVGYDKSKMEQIYPLKLTTVFQDVHLLGKKAWSLLNKLINNNKSVNKKIKLLPKLTVGDSTKRITDF